MANRFARAGGGNWNTDATWSTTSGGAADTVKPTAADDVFLDASSGAVTIDAASVGRSLNCTGYTNVLTHNAFTLTLGDATAGASNIALKLVSGMTYTLANVATSAIAFISTSSTQQTIDCGTKTVGNLTFTGASQNYAFTSAITTDATATITTTGGSSSQIHFDGAADNSALTHSIGKYSNNNSNTQSIFLGNAAITITGTGSTWTMGTSANQVLTQGTLGTLIFTGNASTAKYGGVNCSYRSITHHIGTGTETNGGTFIGLGGAGASIVTLLVDGTGGPDDRIAVSGPNSSTNSFTVTGTWTITGATSVSARITMWPDSQANVKKITVTGATLAFTYVDIQDINFVSTGAVDFSGTTGNAAVGDCGGNTCTGGGTLTFLSPTTQHWTSTGGGNWSDVTKWTSRIPLAQDNVVMDVAFVGTPTITCDRKWLCSDIDWSGSSGNVNFQGSGVTSSERYITGSITGKSNLTWKGNSSEWFINVRKETNFLTDASTVESSISKITLQAGNGGTFNFNDHGILSCPLRLYGGTINLNNKNITVQSLEIGSNNAGNATIFNMGSGTFTLTGTGNVLFPTTSKATNWAFCTVNAGTSTIAITNTSASTKTFQGGDKTYNDVKISGGGSGAVIFTDANTFNRIYTNGGGTKTITLPGSTTTTIISGAGLENGTNLITFQASAGSATVSKASGTLAWDYVSLTNIPSTGGAAFYAGPLTHSTDGGGNTGWSFTNAPVVVTLNPSGNSNFKNKRKVTRYKTIDVTESDEKNKIQKQIKNYLVQNGVIGD